MVNREVILLTAPGEPLEIDHTALDIEGAESVDLIFVTTEAEFIERLPPRRNPLAFFISHQAALFLSPGTMAYLAARPITFPPIILFGPDPELMRLVLVKPNSVLETAGENFPTILRTALHYWAVLNVPLD